MTSLFNNQTFSDNDRTDVPAKAQKQSQQQVNQTKNFTRHCHNWNNRCNFRECKFSHSKAPLCNFDGNYSRKKCMYLHVKQSFTQSNQLSNSVQQQQHQKPFLGHPASFPLPMNPASFPKPMKPWFYPMMNPWETRMNPFQGQSMF